MGGGAWVWTVVEAPSLPHFPMGYPLTMNSQSVLPSRHSRESRNDGMHRSWLMSN